MPDNKNGLFDSIRTRLGLFPAPDRSIPRNKEEIKERVDNLLRESTIAEIIGKPLIGGFLGYQLGGTTGGLIGATTLSVLDILKLLEKPKTPNF